MKKDLTLKELLEDLKQFDKDYWVAPKGKENAAKHITLHLGKLLGKISEVVERWEHGFKPKEDKVIKEVIPDLLIYALRLADLWDIDLQEAYFTRQKFNRKRIEGWKPGADNR